MKQMEKSSKRRKMATKLLKGIGKTSLSLLSAASIIGSYGASAADNTEAAKTLLGEEGSKKAFNEALKMAKGKPAMSVASDIICLACNP